MKLHLSIAYILPIIEYPVIPLATLNRKSLLKLQRVQNQILRFVYNEKYPYTKTMEELHRLRKIEPVNTRLFDRAKEIINKMEETNNKTLIELKEEDDEKEHTWF